MLDNKSLIVLTYLKNHFKNSESSIDADKIHIDGMSMPDIEEAFLVLYNNGYIELNTKYVHPIVEKIFD